MILITMQVIIAKVVTSRFLYFLLGTQMLTINYFTNKLILQVDLFL